MKRLFGVLLVCMLLPASLASQSDFDILSGQPSVSIPFQYVNNFILVQVRLFGVLPLTFIFDTGAEHTILFQKDLADVFNTQYDLRVPIIGSDLSREVYALVSRAVDIKVEGLQSVKRDILVLEENYLKLDELTGKPIHGILGSSFFRNVIIQLDFRKQLIILHNPFMFQRPAGAFQDFDIDVRGGKPYLTANVMLQNGPGIDVTLLVDTGAGLPLLLHNNTDPRLKLPEHHILGKLGLGLGGLVEGYVGRIGSLNIGDLSFPQMITSFQDLSNTVMEDSTRFRNGLIGTQLLTRFHVYIDLVNEKIYLRAYRNYKKKFKMDKSGLTVFATGQDLKTYVIQDIIPDSPATKADLRTGDVIKKVQGLPAGLYSLSNILRLFQKREGKVIRFVIQRGEVKFKKRITLKELI